MNKKYFLVFSLVFFLLFHINFLYSQPKGIESRSANVLINKYTGPFLFGSNMGYLNGNWSDQDVSDILTGNKSKNIEGVGVISLRPALYESFVEQYGYEIRIDAFKHYHEQGAKNNTVFIGDRPSDVHREKKQYISGVKSESYETLYEPIWDKGENGTPVNDKNDFALYVYKLVKTYGSYVKFWEIKNEPDYTPETTTASNEPGVKPNWWDEDPAPGSLKNLHAPVYSYIRMLRVAYEVIKYVDPEAFICTGGIGYLSFLDALLRNTDNPDGGKVTDEYPLKGGAWFDCLSYHNYPMYYLREWVGYDSPGNINGFKYYRNSDAAAKTVTDHKNSFNELLEKYGYTYPRKEFIITETNIPNKQVKDYIGSEEAQRNYLLKLAVTAQKNDICGVYVYGPWDNKESTENGGEYDYKGFYKPLPTTPGGGKLRIHESGVAWRTSSRLLGDRKYDPAETATLNLSSTVDGGAFYSPVTKDYIYVLWAKTTGDRDETASAAYRFPDSKKVTKMLSTAWDETETVVTGDALTLTGTPVFIRLNTGLSETIPVTGVSLDHSFIRIPLRKTIQLTATVSPENAKNKNVKWSVKNTSIASVDQLGKVTALNPGTTVITVTTEDGNKTASCEVLIRPDSVALSYIQLSPSYKNMEVGDAVQLQVTFVPENTTHREITWSSSNNAVATVSENGIVTARSPGNAIITANPFEGEGKKAKTSTISVKGQNTNLEETLSLSPVIAPNPSKGDVNIQFELKKRESVQIDLYSTGGRLLHKLLPARILEPGFHIFTFNPGLPAGTYIISLRSTGINEQHKWVVF